MINLQLVYFAQYYVHLCFEYHWALIFACISKQSVPVLNDPIIVSVNFVFSLQPYVTTALYPSTIHLWEQSDSISSICLLDGERQ